MATKLESFPQQYQGRGRKQLYDWKRWLDGEIWELKEGEDFKTSMSSFRTQAHNAARMRQMKVRVHVNRESETLILQGYKDES